MWHVAVDVLPFPVSAFTLADDCSLSCDCYEFGKAEIWKKRLAWYV